MNIRALTFLDDAKEPSLEEQYLSLVGADPKCEMATPLRDKSQYNPQKYPEGFFKLLARSGRRLGLGFFCSKCGVSALGLTTKNTVKHCGNKVERVPTGWASRTAFWLRLKEYTMPRMFWS